MLDITITAETKNLIDKFVHTENKNDIADIVKKLIPDATDFTAMLYANYTEYGEEYEIDQFMDIEKEDDRIKFLEKNCENYDGTYFNEMLTLIPYMPLNEEERLYRGKFLKFGAPKQKNKYLEELEFLDQEWREINPIDR